MLVVIFIVGSCIVSKEKRCLNIKVFSFVGLKNMNVNGINVLKVYSVLSLNNLIRGCLIFVDFVDYFYS